MLIKGLTLWISMQGRNWTEHWIEGGDFRVGEEEGGLKRRKGRWLWRRIGEDAKAPPRMEGVEAELRIEW